MLWIQSIFNGSSTDQAHVFLTQLVFILDSGLFE